MPPTSEGGFESESRDKAAASDGGCGSSLARATEQLGASPTLLALGLTSGTSISCYFAACGYFMDKFDDARLFGLQNLVVQVVNFLVLVLQNSFDEWFDRRYGVKHTYGVRLIFTALAVSSLSMAVPFCASTAAVLLVGATLSFMAASHFCAAMQLVTAASAGGSLLVTLGATIGGTLPVFTTYGTGFGPGCSFRQALWFYVWACLTSLVGTVVWAVEHFLNLASVSEDESPSRRLSATGLYMESAYRSLSEGGTARIEEPSPCRTQLAATVTSPHAWGILINFFVGFLIVPLFTLAKAEVAQGLYLCKCIGDLGGRVLATVHSVWWLSHGPWTRGASFGLIAVRCVLTGVVLYQLLVQQVTSLRIDLIVCVTLIYLVGGYAYLLLDLDAQLECSDAGQRKHIQRRHLNVFYGGQIAGVLVGLGVLHVQLL